MAKMKHITKITLKGFLFITLISGFFVKNLSFSQCPSSTNVFFQNFNSSTGTFNTGATGTAAGKESKGAYAATLSSKVEISNNMDACCAAGPDHWRENLTVSPGLLPTGNDGGTSSDYAMLVDGGMINGSFWCDSVTVSSGDIYSFSAYYTSPWLEDKQYDPGLYFTINGVQIGSVALVDQYNPATGAPQPYTQQECYYTIPAGTSGKVAFCLNLMESNGCTGTPTTTVGGGCTYPATTSNGQGNDILVDDISIKKCTSGGTTSGCTYAGVSLPVELLSFDAKKMSNSTAALTWTTATEKNASYFSVEKSNDGQYFSEIGTVNAQGNSANLVNYQYSDNYFNVTSYYRLKIIDIDGAYKHSGVIVLGNNDENATVINLGEGKLEIKALANEDTEWNIAVYSLFGQEYINEKFSLKKGENSILKEISGEESAKIVRITALDGSAILSQVIVW